MARKPSRKAKPKTEPPGTSEPPGPSATQRAPTSQAAADPACRCQSPGWVVLERSYLKGIASRTRKVVSRLRADAGAYKADNLKLVAENKRLRSSLRKELDLSVESPAFKNGLAGRTAVGTYRNENVARFIQHVNEVGDHALVHGEREAKFFLMTAVKADLECLYAAPPATEEEGQRRADCEWMLTAPEAVEILAGTKDWNEAARVSFISRALSAGVDTSTHELIRRSGEMPRAPASRPDED